jgi:hypothetical protein
MNGEFQTNCSQPDEGRLILAKAKDVGSTVACSGVHSENKGTILNDEAGRNAHTSSKPTKKPIIKTSLKPTEKST